VHNQHARTVARILAVHLDLLDVSTRDALLRSLLGACRRRRRHLGDCLRHRISRRRGDRRRRRLRRRPPIRRRSRLRPTGRLAAPFCRLAMVVAIIVLVGAAVGVLEASVVAGQHGRLAYCLVESRRQRLARLARRPTRAVLAALKPLAVQEVAILEKVVDVFLHYVMRACIWLEASAVEGVEDVDMLLVHEANLGRTGTRGRGS